MRPAPFTWDGDAMVPHQRFRALCDQQFTIGEQYTLIVDEPRSQVTHNHYFAAIHEGWLNLPEAMSAEYPTDEHLRKKMLVRAGFADERSVVCASKAEAQRVAAFVRPIDSYAVILVSEATVRVFTAKSQSKRAMGAKEFQRSKQAVLDEIAKLIGITADDLHARARAA